MILKRFSKNFLCLLFVLLLQTSFTFAQSNLELANKYYNADDYTNSVAYFKKAIVEDKQYDGEIFYRYAYSLEQIGSREGVYAPFYVASAYCFEKANNTEGKYYSYAKTKEEKLELTHGKFTDKMIEKLVAGKTITSFEYKDKTTFWLVLIGIIIILNYIIGKTLSTRTTCVILSSVGELILLLLPLILVVLLAFNGEKVSSKTADSLFFGSFCISIISAIVFSIYENCYSNHPVLYTVISLIIKIGLFFSIPIVLIIILSFPLKKVEKDRRYRDGTRNNQETKNWGIIIFLFTCFARLIYSLFKEPNRKNEKRLSNEY